MRKGHIHSKSNSRTVLFRITFNDTSISDEKQCPLSIPKTARLLAKGAQTDIPALIAGFSSG